MADEKKNQLDSILDEMLANYSAVEPRPGFEQRLVTVLSESESRPRWFETLGLRWAIASAAAVILVVALYLFWPATSRTPQQTRKTVQPSAPGIEQPPTRSSSEAATADHSVPKHPVVHHSRPVMANASVPKLETFPAHAPLTDEERLLLSYMARTPRQELIAQSRPDVPLAPELQEGFPAAPQNFNTQRNSR
ncbi:MAG TPA: hypothetical protein VE783_12675 [Candidatus Limnocylindrales bacterium]|jgi:hypothetical protein|nr:hypothetical protein [Candidatus Limnocylindrales bacterium]